MGLSISWVASRAVDQAEMLDALGLAASGGLGQLCPVPVPAPARFAAFELDGWRFVVAEDHRFASRERVIAVSRGGDAVGAYLEEHVMFSGAFGASDGALTWSAQHDCNYGLEHLDVWGAPPAALAGIYNRLLEMLRNEGGADYVFDAPTDLAASVCGFNPNTFERELDVVGLKVVRKDLMKLIDQPLSDVAGAPTIPTAPTEGRKPGLFARLFGRG